MTHDGHSFSWASMMKSTFWWPRRSVALLMSVLIVFRRHVKGFAQTPRAVPKHTGILPSGQTTLRWKESRQPQLAPRPRLIGYEHSLPVRPLTSSALLSAVSVSAGSDSEATGGTDDQIENRIAAKGDQIRQLKADGISKEDLAPHVEELLALKALANPDEESKRNALKKTGGEDKVKRAGQKVGGGEASESEIRQARLDKVTAMVEAGQNPYAYSFNPTHTAVELKCIYEGKLEGGEEDENADVSVAGRVMTRRVFGKLAFFTLLDESGTIQLQLDKKRLGAAFKDLKAWTDSGDIIGVRGTIRRTDKGELSVYCTEWKMLTKSALPLPDKFHGLTDISKRYRQRHLDLIVNSDVRDTFRKRALMTSALRQQLNDLGFLEIETPVLHNEPGGAEAKPFETYHNSMGMDLTLRIATELHLKRLIVGGFHKVYELGRIFRNEGISTRHNPEFTSVELYQAYSDYNDMMELTEDLICGECV